MTQVGENIKVHCNQCLGERWHKTLHFAQKEHVEEYDEPGNIYHEICDYRLVECNGCESISLHTEWWCNGQSEKLIEQWPPKLSRRPPKWVNDLFFTENIYNPFKREFLHEIYVALRSNSVRLAVLGIRALLEQVMIESIDDQGRFIDNLEKFQEEGFISKRQREALGPVIEAGHASMHRGYKPTLREVEAIMDVVENVIESIYISKQKSSTLNVPPRPQRSKK